MSRVTAHPFLLLWLAAVWVGLWGTPSWANLLGGLAVAAVLLVVLPLSPAERGPGVRPAAALALLGVFAWELVKASVVVVAQVLRPRASLRQAVVAVDVRGYSDRLVTLLANAVSLTPGTLSLETGTDGVLYVHVLNVPKGGVEEVRASIGRLQRMAERALGETEVRR